MKVVSLFPRTLIALLLALASTASLAAQELPGSIKGFKKETLEVYFNRADQERASSAWERVAHFGAEAAISQWEREAAELYSEPDQITQARDQLTGWVGSQMQQRYESWLTRRFFEQQGSLGSEAVLQAISDANLQYLYATDGSGKIVLDESGDPILREATGLQADRESWRTRVGSAADQVLAAWEQKVDASFAPELGDLLGPEALAKYGEYKISLKAGMRREMERAALQGELSLTARRLYDQYSLRKKSESATADAIVTQIVKETRAQTDEGIAQIKAGLDLTPESVVSRAPAIDVQNWLESFKAAFEKGLSIWDSAEEEFLVSRMEWERDAGKSYAEGESAWTSAFQRLKTERRTWEQQVDALLQTGQARWDQAGSELSAAIEGARGEFQKECTERLAGMKDQMGALVDMYAQSIQVVATAVASGQEIIRKLEIKDANGEYVKFSKSAVPYLAARRQQKWAEDISGMNAKIADMAKFKDSWIWALLQFFPDFQSKYESQFAALTNLVNQMRSVDAGASVQGKDPGFDAALVKYLEYMKQTDSSQSNAIVTDWERMNRAGDWLTMIDTYTAQASTAKGRLEDALSTAFGSEATDLRNVLTTDSDSGVVYLDDYQLELLRAKAVQDYWTQRKAIADAVVAYAQDISSGRETENEGAQKFTVAQAAYGARLTAFRHALSDLSTGGTDLAAARDALERAQAAIEAASASYEEAREKYLDALVSSQSGSVDFYRGQIEKKYAELLEASGMSGTDTELSDATTQYFAAARRYGFDLAVQAAWSEASVLVKGDPETGLASLAELEAEAQRIHVPASVSQMPSTLEALGMPVDASDYSTVSGLFAAWRDAPAGQEKDLAGWKLMQYLRISSVKSNAAYVQRLAEVKAYGAIDAEAWYVEAGGARTEGKLEDRLTTDSTAAFLTLLAARAGVEMRGLEAWTQLQDGQAPSDADAFMLAQSARLDLTRDEAENRIAAISSLLKALGDISGDVSAAMARLREKTSTGGWILAFTSGEGSFVNEQAGDLSLGLCRDQYQEAERARGIEQVWRSAASESTALVEERESAALDGIRKVLANVGLTVGGSGVLPASEDLAIAIKRLGAEAAADFVAVLSHEMQAATSNGPQWLRDRMSDYCSALEGCSAAEVAREITVSAAQARASAAETSAELASAALTDLQSSGTELMGESRFTSLVALFTRPDTPSASAVAARNLIVNAGAVMAAKKTLADPALTLDSIAGGLAPAMTVALAHDIAQRAAEILQTNSGGGAAGQRIAAYRTWSTLSVAEATSGIAVNPLIFEAKRLWDEVASRTFADQAALGAALSDYLASFDPGNFALEPLRELCDRLEAGLQDKETLFRSFLFGEQFDARLASFDELGVAGKVYKRATALRITSQVDGSSEGRDLALFLLERTGITGADDAPAITDTSYDLDQAAFSGGDDLSLEYLCKVLLARGSSIPDGLLEKLTDHPEVRSEVASFQERLQKVRGYIPALDESAQAYVQSLGGDFTTRTALAASIEGMQWDDELFASRAASDYLTWYDGVTRAELNAACPEILHELTQKSMLLSKEAAVHTAESSYWHQVEKLVGQSTSWRSFLSEANVGSTVIVETASTAITRDTQGYVRSVGDLSCNSEIEAFNELARQEGAIAVQMRTNSGGGEALLNFHSFLDSFAAGTVPETDLPEAAEKGLIDAENSYRSALARMQGLKDDIRRSGEALTFLDLDTPQRQERLAGLKQEMDGLAQDVSARQDTADAALDAFETKGASYNRLYADLQEFSNQLENARFALRVQEEIRDWAANGYLASSGESADSYQSPAQRQSEASEKLVRATAAIDALKELYGSDPVTDRPVGDPATLTAYESWKESYAQMLRLDCTQGELDEATLQQSDKVDAQYSTMQDARKSVLDGMKVDANLRVKWSDMDQEDRAGNWASYLTLKNGELSLNISNELVLQVQDTEDEWQSIKNFFEIKEKLTGDPPESTGKSAYDRQMEAWLSSLGTLVSRFGSMDALIDRWGFAADYLKRQIHDKNGAAMQGLLNDYQSDDSFIGNNEFLGMNIDGRDFGGEARDYIRSAVAAARSKYTEVMNDSAERKAFEFYFAMRLAGAAGVDSKFDQFNSRTTRAALQRFSQRLADYAHHLRDNAGAPLGFIGDAINGWSRSADALDRSNDKAKAILGNMSYTTGSTLATAISTFKSAKSNYESGCARLAELRGTNSASLASVDAFLSQYRKLAAQRQGTSVDRVNIASDLESSFRSFWTRLGVGDKASFSKALEKMTVLANADVDEAHRIAVVAAQTAQDQATDAQHAYHSAYDSYFAGSGIQADLEAAARRAYRDSAWVGKAEQELSTGVLNIASFPDDVLVTAAEAAARIKALQLYAQEICTTYERALATRGAALQQEWDQSVQDLGDRQQSWFAQVGLVRAKASSSWDASQQKLVRALGEWRQGFQQEYADKSEAWRRAYLNLGERKLGWVQATREKAGQAGNEAILSEVGASADDISRNAGTLMIASMSYDPEEATVKVESLLGEVGSAQALTALRRMNAGIAQGSVVVASGRLGVDTSGAKIAAEAKRFVQTSRKELASLAARGLADDARQSVEEAKKALADGVKEANEGFEQNMDETFFAEGYAKSEGEYRREAIVRSTFFDFAKTEGQNVGGYRWYAMPALQLKVDLSQSRLSGLEGEAVIGLVGVAQEEVVEEQKKIFGEGKKLTDDEKKAKGLLVEFSANGETVKKEIGGGEFGKYIGYAPEFTKEPNFDNSRDRNVVVTGTGELGRLMGDFIWNEMKESRGWAEMSEPAWDKPLWDDTGSWFKAPNLRSVGSIAAGIAATLVTGGGASFLVAAAVGASSTVLFDTMDVMGGYKSWEEAGLDIGKSFLTSAVTGAAGAGFAEIGKGWAGLSGTFGDVGRGVVGKTLLAGAQSFTTNTATSAINAFSWSNGGLSWNDDAFSEGAFGTGAIASTIGASAGAFTTTSLTKVLNAADNKFYAGAVSLAGGAATELGRYGTYLGYEYASGRGGNFWDTATHAYDSMGGVTLNVANAGAILDLVATGVATTNEGGQSDLGRYARMLSASGLMELNLGRNGITGRLGTGGTDVGGGLYRLGKGMVDKSILENYIAEDSTRGTIAMNAYVYGDWTAENAARRVGIGKDDLTFGFGGAKGAIDSTTKGYTQSNSNGGRTIFLKDGGTAPGALLNMAVSLQHEAYRNGVADSDNGLETYRAVKAHTEMAAALMHDEKTGFLDQGLANDITAYNKGDEAFRKYVGDTYEGNGDYWKLTKTGKLVWDNQAKLTWEATGKVIDEANGESIEAALIRYMGGKEAVLRNLSEDDQKALSGKSDTEIARILIQQQGVKWNEGTGYTLMEGKEFAGNSLETRLLFEHGSNLQRQVDSWNSWDANKDNAAMKYGFSSNFEKYDSFFDLYMQDKRIQQAGSPAAWIATNIKSMTFFDNEIYVNEDMRASLTAAQEDIGQRPGWLTKVEGFWPRLMVNPEHSNELSKHAFGDAIDVNATQNAQYFLTNKDDPTNFVKFLDYVAGKDVMELGSFAEMANMNANFINTGKDLWAFTQKLTSELASVQLELAKLNADPYATSDAKSIIQQRAAAGQLADRIQLLSAVASIDKRTAQDYFGNGRNQNGLFTISQQYYQTMSNQNLSWGGTWGRSSHQWDFMHFEYIRK